MSKRKKNQDGDDLHHWMETHATSTLLASLGLPPNTLSKENIRLLLNNPNCNDMDEQYEKINGDVFHFGVQLLLDDQQMNFIADNYQKINFVPIIDKEKVNGSAATRCEAQAINDIIAAIQCKNINRDQIGSPQFLFSAFRDEINTFWHALELHHNISDAFKLYLNLPKEVREANEWDYLELPFPIGQVLTKARAAYGIASLLPDLPQSQHVWRDAGQQTLAFRNIVVVLIQILWVGVHPFR